MANLYLYLARTDNRGIKILTVFNNKSNYPATQIKDITILHLPQAFTDKLRQSIDANSQNYTTWMESANNFDGLKSQMVKRGYSNLYYSNPLHPFEYEPTYTPDAPDLIQVKKESKTMVQKISL
jgi:hypothetical protein